MIRFEAEQGNAMKTSWILTIAPLAAGYMMMAEALAAPLPGGGVIAQARADLVQAVQSSEAIEDRMTRSRQHRSILQSALQPQARALRPPEPVIARAPAPSEPAGEGLVTCEAAARIVADFGFSDIGSPDCSGDLYRFSAMRDGTAYAIGISAATGEIAEVSRQ